MSPSPSNPTVRKWGRWGTTWYDGRDVTIGMDGTSALRIEAADVAEFIATLQDIVRVEPPEHVCAPVVVCRCPTCGDDSFPLPDDADHPTDLEQRLADLEANMPIALSRIRALEDR